MYRFINYSKTLMRSKKSPSVIFKCFICDLKTIHTRPIIPLKTDAFNLLTHHKFCTQQEHVSDEYVSEEDIQLIAGGDPDLEHKLRVIILEADVMRQDGKCVPSFGYMKHHHWQELLAIESRSARSKYLTYLFKTEMKTQNDANRKIEKRLKRESEPKIEYPDDGKIRYHLGGNHMFLRIYDSTMNNMYNNKLIQAIRFGQKLIIDCGFHNNMTARENSNCAKQLMLMFSENRFHNDPFDMHYCNLQKNNHLHKILHSFIPTMYDAEFPMNVHEKSYLDIFPTDKLIYLTPHCREEMTEFDHDALYIVGAIVDKVNNEPLTLAKAKQEGIRMVKLPLDRYLHWGAGSGKSLTINQVISILLDIKHTGDWLHSLRHVPRRKLTQSDQLQSVRRSERTDYFNPSLPVSKQLIETAMRSNHVRMPYEKQSTATNAVNSHNNESNTGPYIRRQRGTSDVEDDRITNRNKSASYRSSWKPQTENSGLKSERSVDVKRIFDSDR